MVSRRQVKRTIQDRYATIPNDSKNSSIKHELYRQKPFRYALHMLVLGK